MVGGHQTVLKICSLGRLRTTCLDISPTFPVPLARKIKFPLGEGVGKVQKEHFIVVQKQGPQHTTQAPFLVLMSPTAACPRTPPQGPLQRAPVEPRPIQLVLQDMFPPRSAGSALPGLPSTTGPGKTQQMAVLGCGCSALRHPLAIRALLPTAHAVFRCDFPHSSPRVMSAS